MPAKTISKPLCIDGTLAHRIVIEPNTGSGGLQAGACIRSGCTYTKVYDPTLVEKQWNTRTARE